jgi:4'-phosphopantetheinyl transferase
MLNIYALDITTTITDKQYQYYKSCISNEKLKRINKYHYIEDAKRTLYGDIFIRHLITQNFRLSNDELIFSYNNFGKPFLLNYPNYHYNISHSGNWVVCATSYSSIGIDIEEIKPITLDMAKRFFSSHEYKVLFQKSSNKQLDYFYKIWTLKECYIKYIGKGLSIPLDSFSFKIANNNIGLIGIQSRNLFFNSYDIFKTYKLSICAEEQPAFDKISVVDIRKIHLT